MSQEPAESEATKPGCLGTILGAVVLFVIAIVVKLLLWRLSER
jgi:hypothetical protein